MALPPAAEAFDAIAERFDERYGSWLSVAAQRRAVRSNLLRAFPVGSRVLEIGGGTGEDAVYLASEGRVVQLTDPSPAMVRIAGAKLASAQAPAPLACAAEDIGSLAPALGTFDGAFSNFAGLNCITDLTPVASGLASLIRPRGQVLLVIFGTWSVGEWIVETMKGRPRAAVRRFSRGDVHARLGGREFTVRYHRRSDVERAFSPHFTLTSTRGIGICVPPSAAEPGISRYPGLLGAMEALDRVLSAPLAALGDHVLYTLTRTLEPA